MLHPQPAAASVVTVQLRCPVRGADFGHTLSSDVDWLAQHWNGGFRSACPLCGGEHVFQTKDVFMSAAMSRRTTLSDIFSDSAR
jgi:hypothetical protein